MKKIFTQLLAGFLVLVFVVDTITPAVALAASYTDSLTSCGGGVYVPKDQTCPGTSDWGFFLCIGAASVLGIAAASAFAWYPPLALILFSAAFTAGAAICPHAPPPTPDLDVSNFKIKDNVAAVKGSTIKFQAKVSNTGGATTGVKFTNRFDYHWGASGAWVTLGSVSGGPITNGSSIIVVSKDFTLSKTGKLYVRMCSDTGKDIAETDENNNCSSDSIFFDVSSPAPVLNLNLSVSRTGTLTAGQPQTFTGKITNNGTGAATNLVQRICIDNDQCSTTTTGILGASGTISSLGIGILSAPFMRTMLGSQVTNGDHTAYFCVVGIPCVSTSFKIPSNPAVVECHLDGDDWDAGTYEDFYSTDQATLGDCDTGKDTNGVLYKKDLLCSASGTVANDPAHSYVYADCDEVTQTAVTLTANGVAGATSVRKGSSATIAWNGGNADSCTVTALGTTFSGSGVVGSQGVVINQKTVFTATCTLGSGANTSQKSTSVTVNLLPVEVEN